MSKTNASSEDSFSWLNDKSRKFLEAGYLTPGVGPEERIREIAERAEQILDIPGYADKFYHYMSQGFYSLASPVWSNSVSYTHLTLPTIYSV